MAGKNDLIEAQNFSRRRLVTAFVSGAPGGKELEPAAPFRAVVTALALTVGVILAGVFTGILSPSLPNGWENGRLILAKDTGARYVTAQGVLHPVINTASARLLIPAADFAVVTTDQKALGSVELGSTLGIVGAPDALPERTALVGDGWAACPTTDGRTDVRVGVTPAPTPHDDAVVVRERDTLYVVAGERRYAVRGEHSDAVLRAAGVSAVDPRPVSAAWLNLFLPGSDLAPIRVANAGQRLEGTALSIGEVIHIAGSEKNALFVVHTDGTLAALSPLAWQLYQLGSGAGHDRPTEVAASDVDGVKTSSIPAGGADWPAAGFTPVSGDSRACALLRHDARGAQTVLAADKAAASPTAGVRVAAGHGALVLAGGRGSDNNAMLTLIDATGTAYALPEADDETIRRLGYEAKDAVAIDTAWIAFFDAGPALTTDAAGRTPGAVPE